MKTVSFSTNNLSPIPAGSMTVNINCDQMATATSRPTPTHDLVYLVDSVLRGAVHHTPSLLFTDTSEAISQSAACCIDELRTGAWSDRSKRTLMLKDILDVRIIRFRGR